MVSTKIFPESPKPNPDVATNAVHAIALIRIAMASRLSFLAIMLPRMRTWNALTTRPCHDHPLLLNVGDAPSTYDADMKIKKSGPLGKSNGAALSLRGPFGLCEDVAALWAADIRSGPCNVPSPASTRYR